MQKVISINLNGNAYQLDESGYDALREYLASRRAARWRATPIALEIIADLEQAIADKCQKFLGPHKSVVNAGGGRSDRQGDGPDRRGAGQARIRAIGAKADGRRRTKRRTAAEAAVPESPTAR